MNLLAKSIIDKATSEGKNPAAVMLGRLGGLNREPAKKQKEIAQKAAEAGWGNKPTKNNFTF